MNENGYIMEEVGGGKNIENVGYLYELWSAAVKIAAASVIPPYNILF